MRVISTLACLLIAIFALMNVHATPNTPLGLASNSWPIFGVLVAAPTVAAAIRPGIGAFAVFEMVAVVILANGSILLGLLIMIMTALWWWYFAKDDAAQAFSVLCTPLFGAVGFGAVGPIMAGSLLTIGRATAASFFSAFMALVFAAMGSSDLMNWTAFASWDFAAVPMEETFLKVAMMPQTWFTAGSWLAATIAYSLACARGSRRFDISGAVVAAAFLIAGVCLSSGFTNPTEMWALGPMSFIGALFPGVLGILLAYMGVSDRARWEVEEWEEFRDEL